MNLSPDSKRVIRTILQVVAGLAAAMPLLIHTANLPDTLPGVATALTVAGAVTKAMAVWNGLLPGWLRLDVVPDSAPAAKHAAPGLLSGPTAGEVYTPVTQPHPVNQTPDGRPDPAPVE